MKIKEELKELEKQAKRIAKRKLTLETKVKKVQEQEQKLEKLVKDSGYKTPRSLIKALMKQYEISSIGKGKTSDSSATPKTVKASKGKRTRVTVTAKLRDDVKAALQTDTTYGNIASSFGISYPVVKKIEAGEYDKLK